MDTPSYDEQAADFDGRAGLGDEVARAVARGVQELVADHQMARGLERSPTIVEWGCGTGEIGRFLQRPAYLGLDRSPEMLARFRLRCPEAELREADGNQPWPFADGEHVVVFGSRSLHLISTPHLISECQRVAALIIVGRVEREPGCLRQRMRRRMRELLRDTGYGAREGRKQLQQLLNGPLVVRTVIEREVARWPAVYRAEQALSDWKNKRGLAGIDVRETDKRKVLHQLEQEFLGAGAAPSPSGGEERYLLTAIQLKGTP